MITDKDTFKKNFENTKDKIKSLRGKIVGKDNGIRSLEKNNK